MPAAVTGSPRPTSSAAAESGAPARPTERASQRRFFRSTEPRVTRVAAAATPLHPVFSARHNPIVSRRRQSNDNDSRIRRPRLLEVHYAREPSPRRACFMRDKTFSVTARRGAFTRHRSTEFHDSHRVNKSPKVRLRIYCSQERL